MKPTNIYHGSAFNHEELKPGFKRSGKLVSWDETESNKYLYATTDRDAAVILGFASSLDKHYLLDRFITNDNKIIIQLGNKPLPFLEDLLKIDVYLYQITFDEKDGWIHNHNEYNNLTTEYKTKNTIKSNIVQVDKVDLKVYFKNKKIKITDGKPEYSGW